MAGRVVRGRAGRVLVVFGLLVIGLGSPVAAAAKPMTLDQIGLQPGDVPGYGPIDPSIETFTDPNDQGVAQSFIQCAGSTVLLQQFDSGADAAVSQVYGQGTTPFGGPVLAIASAVFGDGSANDAVTAYQRLASSGFQQCWASTNDALNQQQGITVPTAPSTVSPLAVPALGDASTAFVIHLSYTALGTAMTGELGAVVIRSGNDVVLLLTTAYGRSFPLPVLTVAAGRVVARVPVPVPVHIDTVVFLHGIRAGCDEPGESGDSGVQSYQGLFDAVVGGGTGMYSFCYDHDLAFGRHANWSTSLCFAPTTSHGPDTGLSVGFDPRVGPLYASQPAQDAQASTYYDTLGPLAYDATKLDDCLAGLVAYDRAHHHAGAIAVIGNSMGGAITRGWLQLAQARQSSSLDEVTTVVLLEAASEGSQVALVGSGASAGILGAGGPVSGALLDSALEALAAKFGDLGRAGYVGLAPGVIDLTPGSGWCQSIVAAGAPPSGLHYFTFSVGLQFTLSIQEMLWTVSSTTGSTLGDGVMQLGDPDPEAMPTAGGSEFLPGGAAIDRHQFVILTGPYPISINVTDPVFAGVGAAGAAATMVSAVLNDPYSHFNFGSNTGRDTVPSCGGSHPSVLIASEIARILDDPTTACR